MIHGFLLLLGRTVVSYCLKQIKTEVSKCVEDTWFLVTVRQDCRLILSKIGQTEVSICVDDTWFLVTVRQDCRLILSEIDQTEVSICVDDT